MPVVRIGREMSGLGPGAVLKVLATDRGAVADVPAWAQDTGNEMVWWHENGDHLVFYIRKGAGEA
jgi:TusA-related sulfurtransferase